MPKREDIEQTIATIEARRAVLGDALTDAAIAPLRQQLASLDEQRKLVTVLFADMVGFTATAESMDPEDVRDLIRAYFGRLSAAIIRHGGWIEECTEDLRPSFTIFSGKGDIYHALQACLIPLYPAEGSLTRGIIQQDHIRPL